jgi:phage FluMu gp28-like protein
MATGVPTAVWEPFQIRYLCASSQFAIDVKSRQVGYSFIVAADAVAKRILQPRSTTIFQSINLEEATEKIRYAQAVIDALDSTVRPSLNTENKLGLELSNGSRILSQPCRPARGKARADIVLDEFAHYMHDVDIYTAAVPIITKGGSMSIGSSPFGARGRFWEIYTESTRSYPAFVRNEIPWWSTYALCNNVLDAERNARKSTTEERVEKYGTQRLHEIFNALPLDAFQQEYECAFAVDDLSWITWDEIAMCQKVASTETNFWSQVVRTVDGALNAINNLGTLVDFVKIDQQFAMGVDIGRRHDHTEIMIVGLHKSGNLPLRLNISLGGVPFAEQERVINAAIERLPIVRCLIDETGIGMQLAEDMRMLHPGVAVGVSFTQQSKESWATELRLKMQRGIVQLPLDRDIAYQLHSVRRKFTESSNITFTVDTDEKHHADKFWALALAIYAVRNDGSRQLVASDNPLSDYRG